MALWPMTYALSKKVLRFVNSIVLECKPEHFACFFQSQRCKWGNKKLICLCPDIILMGRVGAASFSANLTAAVSPCLGRQIYGRNKVSDLMQISADCGLRSGRGRGSQRRMRARLTSGQQVRASTYYYCVRKIR
jgi:hypothetical protein